MSKPRSGTAAQSTSSPYLMDFGDGQSRFQTQYGMDQETAYDKLLARATGARPNITRMSGDGENAPLSGNLAKTAEATQNAQGILNNFINSRNEMLDDTGYMKQQVGLAEERGKYEGTRAAPAAALGGYTMDAGADARQRSILGGAVNVAGKLGQTQKAGK